MRQRFELLRVFDLKTRNFGSWVMLGQGLFGGWLPEGNGASKIGHDWPLTVKLTGTNLLFIVSKCFQCVCSYPCGPCHALTTGGWLRYDIVTACHSYVLLKASLSRCPSSWKYRCLRNLTYRLVLAEIPRWLLRFLDWGLCLGCSAWFWA